MVWVPSWEGLGVGRFWILDFGFWIRRNINVISSRGGSNIDFGFWILDFGSDGILTLSAVEEAVISILDFGFWILDPTEY